MIQLDQTITKDFTCHNPTNGQVQDADIIPTCEIFENTTDVPILTPVVTKRAILIGDYRVTFVTSAANGFELGKSYNIIVTATVAGITAKSRIASFEIESPGGGASFKG